MKTLIFSISLLFTISLLKSQDNQKVDSLDTGIVNTDSMCNETFIMVEDMPRFNHGNPQKTVKEYIAENTIYPIEAKQKGIQGKVFVQFVVGKDGKVRNAKILRGVHPLLGQEAIRVIESMPKWQIGRQRGKPVCVLYTFPVNFTLKK